jgi:DNA repair protein RecO (recombination protein O)
LFLAEILYKILQEEERNPPLYQFIESALLLFDAMEEGSANFHAWFLVRLTAFLGIFPRAGATAGPEWFDMRTGTFMPREPLHPAVMDPGTSGLLKTLMTLNSNDLPGYKITGIQRNVLLNKVLEYLDLHFGNVGHLRSTDVLKEVFDG